MTDHRLPPIGSAQWWARVEDAARDLGSADMALGPAQTCGAQHPTYRDIRCDIPANDHPANYHQSWSRGIGWYPPGGFQPEPSGPRRNGAVWSSLMADIDELIGGQR
ncbi:hypothetical protein ABZ215_24890 [Amycolatopsis sp. NPDC006131]|uniref:hypothetical protein n=1 Tax=Amycolatopsis sp. NPDC006131 TaxID=3156731 RepID=UPI0033B17F0D